MSMSTTKFFPGIVQNTVKTERLMVAYLEAGSGAIPLVLVHGNASSSLFFQDLMLELALQGRYKIYAPDLRGYGDTETLPVDATRGVRDYADDVAAFAVALNLPSFHLVGWSLGGNIVMQCAIDYPGLVQSLTLLASGSPFGFNGTKDIYGTPTWPDYAGSGAGTVNRDFVQRIGQGDRGHDATSPRTVMNTFYFKPPFHALPEHEEIYVTSILSTRVTSGNYPGDMTTSQNWPNVAPGVYGVNNALSPKYLNQSNFATIAVKPPVLWIHGVDDQIVADTSLFDFGYLGQLGLVPGWPGEEVYPPQPMKSQLRAVLEAYRTHGGQYREVALPDCGHAPHIEKAGEVLTLLTEFINA